MKNKSYQLKATALFIHSSLIIGLDHTEPSLLAAPTPFLTNTTLQDTDESILSPNSRFLNTDGESQSHFAFQCIYQQLHFAHNCELRSHSLSPGILIQFSCFFGCSAYICNYSFIKQFIHIHKVHLLKVHLSIAFSIVKSYSSITTHFITFSSPQKETPSSSAVTSFSLPPLFNPQKSLGHLLSLWIYLLRTF